MRGAAFLGVVVAMFGAEASASAQTITTLRGIERLSRVKPVEQGSHRCADIGKTKSGDNLDSLTNRLKNRIDMASTFRLTTIGTLLKLPFDATDRSGGDMPRSRNGWKAPDRTRTARYESRAVAVDGYIIAVNLERGGESTNCQIRDTSWFDYHMWVVSTEAEAHSGDKRRALVAELTPRVRVGHAADFDVEQMRRWARDGKRVRVSGWLFLDPDHPDDTRPDGQGRPASRGTIWEIHPIMKIEPAPKK